MARGDRLELCPDLRADGVTNAVMVMNYMGFDRWMRQSWFQSMWPGDDVVDWIGLDPYGTGAATGCRFHTGSCPIGVGGPSHWFAPSAETVTVMCAASSRVVRAKNPSWGVP